MPTSDLFEGLIERDLEDLVIPLVSIDEYESKISDDNIVVAFFVKDIEPAKDLMRFMSKSSVDIMDSEVSNIPNLHGFYLVFCELLRGPDFIKDIHELVNSASGLTGIMQWKFKAYQRKIEEFTLENLEANIRVTSSDKQVAADRAMKEAISAEAIGGKVYTLAGEYDLVAVGSPREISEAIDFASKAVLLSESAISVAASVKANFGLSWDVNIYDGGYILAHELASNYCVLMKQ